MEEERRQGGGRGRGPRIALAGSSRLGYYPDSLIEFLEKQPIDTKILLRRGNKADPGRFEQIMAKSTAMLLLDLEWVRPDPDGGRGATFLRDVDLVTRADLVLCYFDTTEMTGGTAHVVEAATDKETPVYAWGFTGKSFERIGEHDPDDIWGGSVPG